MKKYSPQDIEKKWQKYWDKNKTFAATEDVEKQKFYGLIEFPYPSGAGLHVGHPRSYTAMDIITRKKRMEGYAVLYPIGFDAFGLPTENYAIKTGRPPAEVTAENIANFTRQLKSLGFGFDWSRVIDTTDPKYYKWTQWIFLQFFKAGLAYKKNQPINWCPKDKIGLANEEVVNGSCERCGTVVEKRNKEQWMLGITKYADKLIEGLKEVDYIPQARVSQENWIGKSEGALVRFGLRTTDYGLPNTPTVPLEGEVTTSPSRGKQGVSDHVEVFTTRPDTLFGVTFLAISAELGKKWLEEGVVKNKEVAEYVEKVIAARAATTTREEPEKTGIFSGMEAVNPATGEMIPVWITNYVLDAVGTGAVMGVPAHDERDFAFAQKYGLPMKQVVAPHFYDHNNPPLPEKKTKQRIVVQGIIKHWSEDKVLQIQWKKFPWKTFVIGGAETGENLEEAIRREVAEETGYQHIKSIKKVGFEMRSEWFAKHKDENRYALMHAFLIELADGEQVELSAEEKEIHDLAWVPYKEIPTSFGPVGELEYLWKILEHGQGAYTGEGLLINSGEFSELPTAEARKKITEKFGVAKTNYKLRDWVFSRQRYWGEPIPIVICDKCGFVPVPEDELPLQLPKVDKYEPTDTGESPLSKIEEWVNVDCPRCALFNKKEKYLIFDFDGVLADTLEVSLRARVAAGYSKDRDEALSQLLAYSEKKPHHAKGEIRSDEMIESQNRFVRVHGEHIAKEGFELFTEFVEEIKKVSNVKIAIVSAGSKIYIEEKTQNCGLELTHVLSFEDHHSKEEKIERICKDWGANLQDIYYFTDTKADVYELENCLDRSKIIGCAWGFQGFEKLKEVLPEKQILKNFFDIHELFKPGKARRETDTMPNWAGSSWYWLRYCDPHNDTEFASAEKLAYWVGQKNSVIPSEATADDESAPLRISTHPDPSSPRLTRDDKNGGGVDWYNGGNEHTVLHLLYSRFWNQFLFDQGLVPTLEPYKKRTSHGIILAEDGEKMSKSRGNVVNPDDIVAEFGADALRTYIMFMGPFDQAVSWSTNGVVGVYRFLEKVWNLQDKIVSSESEISDEQYKSIHRLVAKVSTDIDEMKFNTAVAKMMETINELSGYKTIARSAFELLVKVLAPFAPHLAEELWSVALGNEGSIAHASWPVAESKWLVDDSFTLVIQVNGKVRDQLMVPKTLEEEAIKNLALQSEKIKPWLQGQEPKKVIYVKEKLVSIVV